MINALTPKGINIPDGFIVTAESFFYFLLKQNNLVEKIKSIISSIDFNNIEDLQKKRVT